MPTTRLELPFGVHISANTTHSEILTQTQEVESHSASSPPILAETTMVYDAPPIEHSRTTDTPNDSGYTVAGATPSPISGEAASNSMEIERTRFLVQGCSQKVIDTLLQARKSTTNKTYKRVWESFLLVAQQQSWNPASPSVPQILEFLQLGLDKGLRSSTLKVHVSALSAMTGVKWAQEPLIIQFQKACLKLRPPRKPSFPTWDLSVVLEALSHEPFFPLENVSLWDLTLKVTFLIAITSAKRVSEIQALQAKEPCLIFYPDKVVLKPSDRFIPKVSSSFHFNQELCLPTLSTEQGDPHPLDIKSNIQAYLLATSNLRKTEDLLVIPHGFRRGQAATSRTIAAWLVKTIKRAYSSNQAQIPEGLRAHSTRAMATSWAAYCRVSSENHLQSSHLVIKKRLYKVYSARLSTVEFGRAITQSNTSIPCK